MIFWDRGGGEMDLFAYTTGKKDLWIITGLLAILTVIFEELHGLLPASCID